jgi:hypothetical protein
MIHYSCKRFERWKITGVVFLLSNGHSPQIRQNGELLVRMCRGESHFSQKLAKASVGESGEYHKRPHFGECESGESVTAFWQIL